MTTGRFRSPQRFWRTATLAILLAIPAALATAQSYDPRWRGNDGWSNDDWRDDDRRRDDWRDDDWRNDAYRRNDRDRFRRSAAYPLDPRFRERSRDYGGRRGGRFEFRGRIDDEVIFFIRGGQVTVQNYAGRGMQIERWSMDDRLPVGRPVRLHLDRKDGRGRVQLLEAPNPRNNYTAVVRVVDSKGGSDRYHFRLDWR